MLNALALGFFVAGLIALYIVVIRPIIKKYVAGHSGGMWSDALVGVRTKLIAWAIMIPSGLLAAYDFLAPIAFGIEWTDTRSVLPSWAWPLILFAVAAFFRWLRKITKQPESP